MPIAEAPPAGLESLLELGRTGDVAKFITLAPAALTPDETHDELRLVLIRRLIEQGLIARALAFLGGFSPALRQHPEIAAMETSLRNVRPDGRLSWDDRRACFAGNLDALLARGQSIDEIRAAWNDAGDRLELHATRDGGHEVFDPQRGGEGAWRPSFGDHRPQPDLDKLREMFRHKLLSPFVIEGVGLGAPLPWLWSASGDTLHGARPLIYVVETSWQAIAVALHLADWREPLADPRVRLCFGPGAYEKFVEMATAERRRPAPAQVFLSAPWDEGNTGRAEKCAADVQQRAIDECRALRTTLAQRWGSRGAAYWAKRYADAMSGRGEPLRVFGLTSRFTTVLRYSMRDTLHAFEARGCTTHLLIEEADDELLPPIAHLEAVAEFDPDLIFLIDHVRAELLAGLPDDVPFVCWAQDRLPNLFNINAGASQGPLDFCIALADRELVEVYGYPRQHMLRSEMPTNPAGLFPPDVDPEAYLATFHEQPPDAEFDCDVAFATNRYHSADQLRKEAHRRYPVMPDLIDAAYEEIVALANRGELNGGVDLAALIERVATTMGRELPIAMRNELAEGPLRLLTDAYIRRETIRWAADWADNTGGRFHLYGKDWEADEEFARFARGAVPHGPRLGHAFRTARVNLHATCNSALHQRVLDGLAAGGFFLIREHANDFKGGIWPLAFEVMKERGLVPGDTIRIENMPDQLRAEWTEFNRLSALPLDTPIPLIQANFDQMHQLEREKRPLPMPRCIWPEFPRIVFRNAEELGKLIEHFRDAAEERRELAKSMRRAVLERFSYQGLMSTLLSWMRDQLAS